MIYAYDKQIEKVVKNPSYLKDAKDSSYFLIDGSTTGVYTENWRVRKDGKDNYCCSYNHYDPMPIDVGAHHIQSKGVTLLHLRYRIYPMDVFKRLISKCINDEQALKLRKKLFS